MAKGRQGFALELWKFGVYLMIPVGASIYYNDPDRVKQNADYWQFIKYPPSDPDKVREEVQERIQREKKEQKQRQIYLEQMKKLQESANRSKQQQQRQQDGAKSNGWWGWLGFGRETD
jgi:Pet100